MPGKWNLPSQPKLREVMPIRFHFLLLSGAIMSPAQIVLKRRPTQIWSWVMLMRFTFALARSQSGTLENKDVMRSYYVIGGNLNCSFFCLSQNGARSVTTHIVDPHPMILGSGMELRTAVAEASGRQTGPIVLVKVTGWLSLRIAKSFFSAPVLKPGCVNTCWILTSTGVAPTSLVGLTLASPVDVRHARVGPAGEAVGGGEHVGAVDQ